MNGLELWRGEWVISGLERFKVSDDRHHLDTTYYDKSSNPMLLTLRLEVDGLEIEQVQIIVQDNVDQSVVIQYVIAYE